jgi:hypothetical protein
MKKSINKFSVCTVLLLVTVELNKIKMFICFDVDSVYRHDWVRWLALDTWIVDFIKECDGMFEKFWVE